MTDPLFVVVEGRQDVTVLKRLFANCFPDARYFASGGRSSVVTVARNLLVHERGLVFVIADADTHDPERASNDRISIRVALRTIAPQSRSDVFLFVPELEIIFFDSPKALESLRHGASQDPSLLHHALPKRGLTTLLKNRTFESWLNSLPEDAWHEIRRGPQVENLVDRINALRHGDA
jgi:hypothetical protein